MYILYIYTFLAGSVCGFHEGNKLLSIPFMTIHEGTVEVEKNPVNGGFG